MWKINFSGSELKVEPNSTHAVKHLMRLLKNGQFATTQ